MSSRRHRRPQTGNTAGPSRSIQTLRLAAPLPTLRTARTSTPRTGALTERAAWKSRSEEAQKSGMVVLSRGCKERTKWGAGAEGFQRSQPVRCSQPWRTQRFNNAPVRTTATMASRQSEQFSETDSEATIVLPPTPPTAKLGIGEMKADDVANWLCYKVSDSIRDVGRAFRYYDKDGSGAIDYGEFREFLGHRYNLAMNEYEFRTLMKQVDPDRSGEVDFEEFIDFFRRKNLDPKTWGLGDGSVKPEQLDEMANAVDRFNQEADKPCKGRAGQSPIGARRPGTVHSVFSTHIPPASPFHNGAPIRTPAPPSRGIQYVGEFSTAAASTPVGTPRSRPHRDWLPKAFVEEGELPRWHGVTIV